MLFFLFIISAFCQEPQVCTYDATVDNNNFQNASIYHERFCQAECPCTGNDCTVSYVESEFRDIKNVYGDFGKLITRRYDLTCGYEVPEGKTLKIGEIEHHSSRTLFHLQKDSILSVAGNTVDPLDEVSGSTTIIRCNTSCTVSNSVFTRRSNESISFMPEIENRDKYGDPIFIESTIEIKDVTFTVSVKDGHFDRNYAREKLTVKLENPTFVLDDEETPKDIALPLFYSTSMTITGETKLLDKKLQPISDVKFVRKCLNGEEGKTEENDGYWLYAVFGVVAEDQFTCEDPTVSNNDDECEENSEIAFIVIASLADFVLVVLIIIFVILIVVPKMKAKKGEKYEKI